MTLGLSLLFSLSGSAQTIQSANDLYTKRYADYTFAQQAADPYKDLAAATDNKL